MSVETLLTEKLMSSICREARVALSEGRLDEWHENYMFFEEVIVPGELKYVDFVYRSFGG